MNSVPDEPAPRPALDANRIEDSNLSPQGRVDLQDEVPESSFTPEGDQETVPGVLPAGTKPE